MSRHPIELVRGGKMRSALLILIAIALIAATPTRSPQPQFELERNATLETLQIMMLLAPSQKVPNVGIRPVAEQAKAHFSRYANHPSILLLDKMIREDGNGWLTWLQMLNSIAISSAKPVPYAS